MFVAAAWDELRSSAQSSCQFASALAPARFRALTQRDDNGTQAGEDVSRQEALMDQVLGGACRVRGWALAVRVRSAVPLEVAGWRALPDPEIVHQNVDVGERRSAQHAAIDA